MEKTTFYLIRHGQSEGNLKNLFLGHTDLDLTPLGHQQAQITAEYLSDVHADFIYSSDLKRAYHTALHTAEKRGMKVFCDPDFREIFAGEWEGLVFDQIQQNFPKGFDLWCNRFAQSRCDGGESVAELADRLVLAMRNLAKKHPGKTVFIFMHATPIRVLKAVFDGAFPDAMDSVPWPSNASVSCVQYENGDFRVLEYSRDSFLGKMSTRFE